MKNLYDEMPNGYQESIQKGLGAVRYFSRNMSFETGSEEERIARLKKEIEAADAIVIGAGAGISTSAGLTVKSKFVCKLLLGTCGAKGCLASLS